MTKRWLFARLGVVGVLLAATLAPTPAQSISASLSALDSPVWQTNASVQGIAVAAGKAYVGGRFTSVRPPGSPLGTNEVGQAYLAAFDATTGALVTAFNPVLDGQVYAVAASADGSRIFVGGDFTTVNGVTRNRIAAFDTATGALVTTWKPSVSYRVKTISVAGNTVYFGGSFGLVNGVDRLRLAALLRRLVGRRRLRLRLVQAGRLRRPLRRDDHRPDVQLRLEEQVRLLLDDQAPDRRRQLA